MAETRDEEQRRRRRRRLFQGLALGGAAIGVPALINTVISRRAGKLPATWGKPVAARSESWASRHGRIAYQRLGEGPPVVLLHSFGLGHDAVEWRPVAERLASSFTALVPDFLGWGRSEKPWRAYRGDFYARHLGDFVARNAGGQAVLVAAGHAAAYAVRLAVDRPDLVRGLALVTPHGVERRRERPGFRDRLLYQLLRLPVLGTSALNFFTTRSAIANTLRREVYAQAERVDAALIDRHYRACHQPDVRAALAAYLSGRLHLDVRRILADVGVPAWIAWGRRAASPGVESADLWLQKLPAAALDVFEDCGILPHAEAPGAFARKLEPFLTNLED